MTIPKAKLIGLSSVDPDRYCLPRNVGTKLNDKDIGRAKELLNYELDALANKDFRSLIKTCLPKKLK